MVEMRDCDPCSITPRIKLLLRRHNKFRRAGREEQADHIVVKINMLIAHNRSTALADAKDTDTEKLWAMLKQTGNWGSNKQAGLHGSDHNEINFFANKAANPIYSHDSVMQAARE